MAFLGLLSAALGLFLLRDDTEVVVSEVTAVRSSDVSGAPESVDGRTMVASYYASVLEGNPTASGEAYDPEKYTAAHRTLAMGTELHVSHEDESVRVVVNDRGPYAPGHDLDLSLAAAREIGLLGPGTAPVRVVVDEKP
ncbi:septal ring lytic transglycosylase RlpA family protein [Rubrobacter tropicus]|uniref:Septal ring lytic transglycosylase RlpA family protein n=1 Tax=Rubrobacter tropicus TaxID=2653851 RepID=A0A6G8Q4F6_9ACTN|nr:septal ring lytic transglycosylase RlpA family protein [Rubrobacter tropicus]QIN81309.1 septal ring lytic transglycosylase RlpA family protein [Rubrobacter tropicus]